jgi:hypothetical protein
MATLHLHFYLNIAGNYSVDKFVAYLRGSVDPTTPEEASMPPSDRFADAGVTLDFQKKVVSGTADFKRSLQDPGSVVVYLGHSVLDYTNKRSVGLSPMGHNTAEITPDQLMSLLKASSAKLVILATCASSTLGLEKLRGGPAVVVTNSGSNLKTWSFDWAQALRAFLLLLIGYKIGKNDQPYSLQPQLQAERAVATSLVGAVDGLFAAVLVSQAMALNKGHATISQALDAANEAFKGRAKDDGDRFELAYGGPGGPSTVVFP